MVTYAKLTVLAVPLFLRWQMLSDLYAAESGSFASSARPRLMSHQRAGFLECTVYVPVIPEQKTTNGCHGAERASNDHIYAPQAGADTVPSMPIVYAVSTPRQLRSAVSRHRFI